MLKMPDKGADARKIAEQLNRRQEIIALLKSFELVILEEAHEVSGDGYYQVLKMCTKAYYRLALTATPFMKQNSEANMRLMAVSGPIGIRVTEKQLIDCGILAKPYFKFLRLPKPDKLKRGTPWPSCYNIGVVENEIRNQAIVDEATRAAKHRLPTLILVNRQAHGDNLKKMLVSKGIRTDFIYGKHESEQRMDALEKIKNGKYQVLIGSTILDVGVDVPAIGMVIIACGYKEEVALRQRIGRGLRKKKGANVTFIVCFADEHNHHLAKHAKIRREVISGTPGFREGILDDGDDFDYSLLKS
jgi:superfamily II DNA or RNA helicase